MSIDENCGLDTQLLACFLKNRYYDEKPTDVVSVEVKNAVPKGENYASLVYRVKINCLTAGGRKKCFSVIVKTDLKGEDSEGIYKSFPAFGIETRIYTTLLPMMEEIMEEFGDKRGKLWPNLLGYRPYNMIAFEDLSLVLRNLARFHAMSKVLLERGLITPDEKGKLSTAIDDPIMDTWWGIMLTVLPDAMANHWGDEWKEIAEKLRSQKSVIIPKLRAISSEFDKRFEVFNHGDLWMCNMLFKYMEYGNNLPVSVKFVDYQLGHVNSFIWDVVYFLITSTIPSVRRSRLHELFEAYQLSLEKNLNMLNYTGYIPTLDDVKSEWKRVEYTHMCYLIYQPFMSAETTTALHMEKCSTHPPHE